MAWFPFWFGMVTCILDVYFITKPFLIYSFFPPTPALSTITRPLSSSICSITPKTANVGSSYNRMRGPGIGCWFSDHSNCSHWSLTLTFTLTSHNLSLYTTLLLLLVLIQLCSPRCWHLNSNYCRTRCRPLQLRFVLSPLLLHPHLLGMFQSDIPLFTLTWPAKHSPNQGWESTHRLHLYPLGGVFNSPWHRALGRRDLDFTSHPNDDGEPWERFSEPITQLAAELLSLWTNWAPFRRRHFKCISIVERSSTTLFEESDASYWIVPL